MNRRARAVALAAGVIATAASFGYLGVRAIAGGELRLPHAGVWRSFAAGFEAPDAEFWPDTARAALETVQVSIAGISLAILVAIPLALLGTATLWWEEPFRHHGAARAGRAVYLCGRALMAALRAIPEVLWALLFVRLLGLGSAAGAAAIGIAYGAMLGKVYSELLESTPRPLLEALRGTGSTAAGVLLYGMLPFMRGPLLGYTLFRWECAIRASALVGLVGAGGLGYRIWLAWKYGQWAHMAILLVVLMLLVLATDAISGFLRRRLFHAPVVARE